MVTPRATAATRIHAVAIQVNVRLSGPLTWSFITRRSEPNSTIKMSSGGMIPGQWIDLGRTIRIIATSEAATVDY